MNLLSHNSTISSSTSYSLCSTIIGILYIYLVDLQTSHSMLGASNMNLRYNSPRPSPFRSSQLLLLSILLATTSLFTPVCAARVRSSSGCGVSLPSGQIRNSIVNVTLPSSNSQAPNRSYLIHLPLAYDIHVPAPLILSFHGGDQTAMDQLLLDRFTDAGGIGGAGSGIVVYPQGINVSFASSHI